MPRRLAALAAMLCCLASLSPDMPGARAQTTGAGAATVVVELFTSQGCSACPPAEAVLRRLDGEPGVIALALHVDYWDYLGWRDAFADPRHTDRQKAYAREAGKRTVYTPQAVVHGGHAMPGTRESDIRTAMAEARATAPGADLTLARDGGHVHIAVAPHGDPAPAATVHVVEVLPAARVEVTRGENAGHTLRHRNVVTDWRAVGAWDGGSPWRITVPAHPERDIVVLVQEEGPGAVLAAARLR